MGALDVDSAEIWAHISVLHIFSNYDCYLFSLKRKRKMFEIEKVWLTPQDAYHPKSYL